MHEYKCKILRIVDGDTVDVDVDLGFGIWMHKERVRLLGIDTPESRTRDKEEKRFGLLSKKYLQDQENNNLSNNLNGIFVEYFASCKFLSNKYKEIDEKKSEEFLNKIDKYKKYIKFDSQSIDYKNEFNNSFLDSQKTLWLPLWLLY